MLCFATCETFHILLILYILLFFLKGNLFGQVAMSENGSWIFYRVAKSSLVQNYIYIYMYLFMVSPCFLCAEAGTSSMNKGGNPLATGTTMLQTKF